MAAEYEIIGQKQTSRLNPSSNGFEDVWEVTYRVTSGAARGTVGTVTVGENDHNAEYVKAAIEDKVADLHDVASLGMSS